MKIFIALLVLIFSLQSWTKADDITDFQIEGMSIGDSLLLHVSKNEIDQLRKYNVYPNKDYYTLYIEKEFLKLNTYDFLQIDLKKNDKNFIIPVIGGIINFPNNIDKCKLKKKEIINEIISTYPNLNREDRNITHPQDKTNKSYVYQTYFRLNSGAIVIDCEDWSADKEISNNYKDQLKVYVISNEYNKWINNEAYN